MPEIKVYTTSWCGDCRMTKMFLAEKGISYQEIDIEETPGAAEIVMKANQGKRKVPTLDIDGRFVAVSPFNRRQLEEALGLHDTQAWAVLAERADGGEGAVHAVRGRCNRGWPLDVR